MILQSQRNIFCGSLEVQCSTLSGVGPHLENHLCVLYRWHVEALRVAVVSVCISIELCSSLRKTNCSTVLCLDGCCISPYREILQWTVLMSSEEESLQKSGIEPSEKCFWYSFRMFARLNTNMIIWRTNVINLWGCKPLWTFKRTRWFGCNRMFLVKDVMHESSSSGPTVARRREITSVGFLLLAVPRGRGLFGGNIQAVRK